MAQNLLKPRPVIHRLLTTAEGGEVSLRTGDAAEFSKTLPLQAEKLRKPASLHILFASTQFHMCSCRD